MTRKAGRLAAFSYVLLSTLILGCQGLDQSGLVEPPPGIGDLGQLGKPDVARMVNMRGPIYYENGKEGEFVRDFQFDAYTIYAVEGAVITLYTTGDRNSESMDTTLFFFGPQNKTEGFGDEYLVWDNDSGWGKNAMIANYRVEREGIYLIVVGTPYAVGRGNYVLMAMCETDDCDGDQPVILKDVELPESLSEMVVQAAESCQESVEEFELDCIVDAARFSYARRELLPDPEVRVVVEELVGQYGYSENCSFGDQVTEEEMQDTLDNLGAPEFIETAKTELENDQAQYGWGYCWNYLDDWEEQRVMHYYVLYFPEINEMIAVSVAIWEDHDID